MTGAELNAIRGQLSQAIGDRLSYRDMATLVGLADPTGNGKDTFANGKTAAAPPDRSPSICRSWSRAWLRTSPTMSACSFRGMSGTGSASCRSKAVYRSGWRLVAIDYISGSLEGRLSRCPTVFAYAPRLMSETNPLHNLELDTTIRLRWVLRDIRSRRTELTPPGNDDLALLEQRGLISMNDGEPVLTDLRIR